MRETTIAAILVALIELGGCAKVRYPDYYTLRPPNPVSTSRDSARISASVAVRECRAPQYLRQGSIVYRPESEQFAFHDYHRWAEDPRQSATNSTVRELKAFASGGGGGNVSRSERSRGATGFLDAEQSLRKLIAHQ
jgi:uncharacterized lipoprotein YmbA